MPKVDCHGRVLGELAQTMTQQEVFRARRLLQHGGDEWHGPRVAYNVMYTLRSEPEHDYGSYYM